MQSSNSSKSSRNLTSYLRSRRAKAAAKALLVEFVKAEAAFSTKPVFTTHAIWEERKVEWKTEAKEQDSRKWKRSDYTS